MSNLAVKLYNADSNPLNIPGIWPSQVLDIGDSTILPDNTWLLMTTQEYESYKSINKPAYDAWYLNYMASLPVNIPQPQMMGLDVPKTSTGIQKVAVYEPEGSSATIVTFNYADKCSWYAASSQVTNEILTTTDSLIYSSLHTHWIDLTHGRCYDEDNIMAYNGTPNKWCVKLYIDDVLQAVNDSIWTVNYESGQIVFNATQSGVIKVSYSYATTSEYILRPKFGKKLSIKTSELQFSSNITIPSPIYFEPWFINHPVYGTMPIPGQRIVYKNMKDLISACNGGQGVINKVGELNYDVHVFPFDYARPKPIKYSDCVEIKVYLKDHIPMTGEYATGTFYVAIDDE